MSSIVSAVIFGDASGHSICKHGCTVESRCALFPDSKVEETDKYAVSIGARAMRWSSGASQTLSGRLQLLV